MCATIVWAVNRGAYEETFVRRTQECLGVAPQSTDHRIVSSRVGSGAAHFTLTRRLCDCDGLVGLGDRDLQDGETTAATLLGWVHEMPSFAPHVARLALMRAWSPGGLELRPRRASGVLADQVDEALLRRVGDDALLTIDYPRTR